ncbi:putative deoxyribonuclease tatdn3 [Dinochytrium kinnereticum]|nr:putative deoxyribonuclease tatdn3 [Dinochytrium kinnereticum]
MGSGEASKDGEDETMATLTSDDDNDDAQRTLIDCHAHFYPPNFDEPFIRQHLLLRTRPELMLDRVILTPESLDDFDVVLNLCSSISSTLTTTGGNGAKLFTCLGLHPVHAIQFHETLDGVLTRIRESANHIVGVGEIGLDFSPWVLQSQQTHLNTTDLDSIKLLQKHVFKSQVLEAKSLNLPVNVHSRNAGHHAIAVLEECEMLHRSLLHAFDGAPKHAVRAASLGATFSVAPILVRDPAMRRWIERVPMESLVLESDAPALAPEKGAVNVPANVGMACEALAGVKGVSVEEVARLTRANAMRLFFPGEM